MGKISLSCSCLSAGTSAIPKFKLPSLVLSAWCSSVKRNKILQAVARSSNLLRNHRTKPEAKHFKEREFRVDCPYILRKQSGDAERANPGNLQWKYLLLFVRRMYDVEAQPPGALIPIRFKLFLLYTICKKAVKSCPGYSLSCFCKATLPSPIGITAKVKSQAKHLTVWSAPGSNGPQQ